MAKVKRFSSLLLAIIMAVSAMIIPGTSYAGDFESGLAKAGFTSSYITALSKLHEKYPNWNFVPLITNISLDEGVANERKKHSQQLIQKRIQMNQRAIYAAAPTAMLTALMLSEKEKHGFPHPKVPLNTI